MANDWRRIAITKVDDHSFGARGHAHEMGISLDSPPSKKGVLRLQMARGEDRAALAIVVVIVLA